NPARATVTFTVTAEPPKDGMRDRQAFLRSIGRSVEGIAARWIGHARTEEDILNEPFADDPEHDTPEARESDLEVFEKLADGDVASEAVASSIYPSYAAYLCPAIRRALDDPQAAIGALWNRPEYADKLILPAADLWFKSGFQDGDAVDNFCCEHDVDLGDVS